MANPDPDDVDSVDSDKDFVFVENPDRPTLRPFRADRMRQAEVRPEEGVYRHRELESKTGSFRLLRLFKGERDDVRCALANFDILSEYRPAYRAVSYTWGNDEEKTAIRIDHKPFPIRTNLEALLRCVRNFEYDCWLWIDAICINQTSDKERNQQVKLMGEIYSNANTVLSWLGPYDKEIDYAFDFMSNATSFDKSTTSVEAYCRSKKPTEMIWHQGISGYPIAWEYGWQCVAKFSKLRNWTRKWIIQEIIKPQSVVLQSGSSSCQLPMTVVENFFGQLNGNPYSDASRYEQRDHYYPNKYEINELNRYHKWQEEYGQSKLGTTSVALLARHRLDRRTEKDHRQSLHELLIRYEHYKCKEPSDHVYALFNLIGEHRQHLEVDYTQTPAERCLTVLQFMQRHDGLPQSEVIRFTKFLMGKLGLTSDGNVRDTLKPQAGHETEYVTVTVFDRGATILEAESPRVIARRKRVPALYAMGTMSMRNMTLHGEVKSNSNHHPAEHISGGRIVSPVDMIYFKIRDTEMFGLAATRVRDGDRVWQFQETDLAFIVRLHDIVGRALLFSNHDTTNCDRLVAETISAASREPVSARPSLEAQVIKLNFADLFDLAFWADSMGPAASPFSA